MKGQFTQHPNLDIPTGSKASKDILPCFSDIFSNCELPEITIFPEDIKDSDDKLLFYTRFHDYDTNNAFLNAYTMSRQTCAGFFSYENRNLCKERERETEV